MGVDESVDSLALEDYDYYEDVTKKRWLILFNIIIFINIILITTSKIIFD